MTYINKLMQYNEHISLRAKRSADVKGAYTEHSEAPYTVTHGT